MKLLPVVSYHKYKYFVTFLDDYTSHGWIMMLKSKAETVTVIQQFVSMAKMQYNATIKEFMSDAGGEFKSQEVDKLLRNLGIKSLTSVPYAHQQNSHTERFNWTSSGTMP